MRTRTTPPQGREAEKTLAELQLDALVNWQRTHTEAIARLSSQIVNDVLLCELIQFPATGNVTREFGTAMGSVAVANHSSTDPVVVVAGSAASDTVPATGAAMARLSKSTANTFALTGSVVTLWGKAGEFVTVQVFTRPQPPAPGPA